MPIPMSQELLDALIALGQSASAARITLATFTDHICPFFEAHPAPPEVQQALRDHLRTGRDEALAMQRVLEILAAQL